MNIYKKNGVPEDDTFAEQYWCWDLGQKSGLM